MEGWEGAASTEDIFPMSSDAGELMYLADASATLSQMRDETTVLDGEPDKSSGGADCRGCTRGRRRQ